MRTVHVVGAGLAGLSAAVHLVRAGFKVRLYESAPRAGGRCRSYFDSQLGCMIDNGNHVILGANAATHAYLDAIGSRAELEEIAPAAFPFRDLRTGATWSLRPNAGPLPWWIFAADRRAAGTRALDYLRLARMTAAGADATVARYAAPGTAIFTNFVEPLATAILNTAPEEAAARPLAAVLRATLLRGERACRPAIARGGLSKAFVDPALALLQRSGAEIRMSARLERIRFEHGAAAVLDFADGTRSAVAQDCVVVATPPWIAADLLPGISVPGDHRAIVNAHFRMPSGVRLGTRPLLLGLTGGTAQWLVVRGDVVSTTISAADALLDEDPDHLLRRLWADVATALGCAGLLPPARLIKEKRATFAQTPAAERQRPGPVTPWQNVVLAGDWVATGLPATIEGAIRSGAAAAQIAAGRR